MPRKSRIDAPLALHHAMARGLERLPIFGDDSDRDHFLSRLGEILTDIKTTCYAYALIPNHFFAFKNRYDVHFNGHGEAFNRICALV